MKHYDCQDAQHEKYVQKLNCINATRDVKLYILERFKANTTKKKFQCSNGHELLINAYSVLYGTGCSYCSGKAKKTTEMYKTQLMRANLTKRVRLFVKPGTEYVNCHTKIAHVCEFGHEHAVSPEKALSNKYKCPHCSKKLPYTSPEHIIKHLSSVNLRYVTGEVNGGNSEVTLACHKGHQFKRTVHSIVNKRYGCSICIKSGWSNKCIKWLRDISDRDSINIQHAENGGEYVLPTTNIRVDGFCALTNTVYEFHGDKFHGNLKKFKPTDCPNPFSTKTALELFEDTVRREEKIKSLGYNLIVVWELDYDREVATTS